MNTQQYELMKGLMEGLEEASIIEAIKDCPWETYDNKDSTIMWNVDHLRRDAQRGRFGDCFRTLCPPAEKIEWDNLSRVYVYELIDELMIAKIIHGHPLYAFEPIIVLGGKTRDDGLKEIVDILDGSHRLAAIIHAGLSEFVCWLVPASMEEEYRVSEVWANVIRACYRVVRGNGTKDDFFQAFDAWKASRGLT